MRQVFEPTSSPGRFRARLARADMHERVPIVFAVLGGGLSLGVVAADIVSPVVRLVLVACLFGLLTTDVVLYSSRRLVPWLVGATIVGLALANGTLPVSGLMDYGRFVPPLILFVAVLRSGAWQDRTGSTGRVTVTAGIAIVLVMFSTLTSRDPAVTFEKALAFTTVVVATCATLRWSKDRARWLRDAVLVAFLVIVLTNFAYFFIGSDAYSGSRFRGWTINPNNLAILCAFSVPVGASELMTSTGRRRLVGGSLLAVAAVLLLLSGSRASSLGAVLGLATVFRISGVARSVVFVGSVSALLVLAPLAFRSAVDANVFSPSNRQGNSGRDQVWPIAIREIQNRPLWGAGYSTTEDRFANTEFGRFSVFQGGHFHNSYLEAAVELGILGGVLMLVAGSFALWHLVRATAIDSGWAAGMAVSGAVIGVFETGLLTPGAVLMFPFWLAVGFLSLQARHRTAGGRRWQ